MAVEGGIVSHCHLLVIRKFIDFMSLSGIVCGLLFPLISCPWQSLKYARYGSQEQLKS